MVIMGSYFGVLFNSFRPYMTSKTRTVMDEDLGEIPEETLTCDLHRLMSGDL